MGSPTFHVQRPWRCSPPRRTAARGTPASQKPPGDDAVCRGRGPRPSRERLKFAPPRGAWSARPCSRPPVTLCSPIAVRRPRHHRVEIRRREGRCRRSTTSRPASWSPWMLMAKRFGMSGGIDCCHFARSSVRTRVSMSIAMMPRPSAMICSRLVPVRRRRFGKPVTPRARRRAAQPRHDSGSAHSRAEPPPRGPPRTRRARSSPSSHRPACQTMSAGGARRGPAGKPRP